MGEELTLGLPYAVSVVLVVICALGSAIFSGLTLGLLTLDCVQLKMIMDHPDKTRYDERRAAYARRILKIRTDGNYLLVTLLLGNVAVNSGFTILMGELVSPIEAFIISTVIITLFGEILPQAVCARHGLVVGGWLMPAVFILEWTLYPVVKPIAMILNCILGEEIGSIYSKKQLKALVDHHQNEAQVLTKEEARILHGGLDFAMKRVEEVMTPIDNVFGVDIEAKLDNERAAEMLQAGYSRIPVFDCSKKQCIVGLLFVRDLILMDPESEISVRSAAAALGRPVYAVDSDTTLLSLLTDFKKGHTHLAVVRRVVSHPHLDPYYEHIGIITLEDIIEEILQDEIYDEFEVQTADGTEKPTVAAGKQTYGVMKIGRSLDQNNLNVKEGLDIQTAQILGRVRLCDKRRGSMPLDDAEAMAVALYLSATEPTFSLLKGAPLQLMLKSINVVMPRVGELLYSKGESSDTATIVLQGRVKVLSGDDKFISNLGPWSLLGMKALDRPSSADFKRVAALMAAADGTADAMKILEKTTDIVYTPDYTATVSEPNCRLLRISKADFLKGLKSAALLQRGQYDDHNAQTTSAARSSSPICRVPTTPVLTTSVLKPPESCATSCTHVCTHCTSDDLTGLELRTLGSPNGEHAKGAIE